MYTEDAQKTLFDFYNGTILLDTKALSAKFWLSVQNVLELTPNFFQFFKNIAKK